MGARRFIHSSTGEGARRERRRTTRAASSMWELRCATDDHELASDATAPRMRTLNAHVGRQVWTYVEDDDAEEEETTTTTTTTTRMGSVTTRAFLDAMRRAQDDMRETFVKTRGEMKHARDAFARAQYDARRARRGLMSGRPTEIWYVHVMRDGVCGCIYAEIGRAHV